jgi:hypothetical protein
MYRAIAASAGAGALLSGIAIQSAGRIRLLSIAGAVGTLAYAGFTLSVGSVVGQFAQNIEAKARQSPE